MWLQALYGYIILCIGLECQKATTFMEAFKICNHAQVNNLFIASCALIFQNGLHSFSFLCMPLDFLDYPFFTLDAIIERGLLGLYSHQFTKLTLMETRRQAYSITFQDALLTMIFSAYLAILNSWN